MMNEGPQQTELGLSSPETPPVTSGEDSASLNADQRPIEGAAPMGDESKRNPTTLAPEELTSHELAMELARLMKSGDSADQERIATLRSENARRLQVDQGQTGFMAVEPPKEVPLESDEARRRREALEHAERKFKGKPAPWIKD